MRLLAERQKILKQIEQKKTQLADLQAEFAITSKDMKDILEKGKPLATSPSHGKVQIDTRAPEEVKLDSLSHIRARWSS